MTAPGMGDLLSFEKGPSVASRLGGALGGGIQKGAESSLEQLMKSLSGSGQLSDTEAQALTQKLIERGVDPQIAQLYPFLTPGGKTKAGEFAVEDIMREKVSSPSGSFQETYEDINFQDEPGLTSKEKVARQKEREKRAFERNKNYLENISKKAQALPRDKVALEQLRIAVNDKDFNSIRNMIGEITGFDALKTASAQVVNGASKQFLISELASITGRPNQFIEQQITKALINPVYRDEANQAIFEGLELLSKIKEKEIEIAENLESKYINAGREIPRDFQMRVREKLKAETEKLEKDYEKRLKQLFTSKTVEKGETEMIGPDGQTYAVPTKDIKRAENAGYKRIK